MGVVGVAAAMTLQSGAELPAACAGRVDWPSESSLSQLPREDMQAVWEWIEQYKIRTDEDVELLVYVVNTVARAEECVRDFDSRTAFEARCPQMMYKVGIQRLHREKNFAAAERLFLHARALRYRGRQWIFWEDPFQTPTVFVRDLPNPTSPFFDCSMFPVVEQMRKNFASWGKEALTANEFLHLSYPYLGPEGTWLRTPLYENKTWYEDVCASVPSICNGLKELLPTTSTPYVVPNNEMAILFMLGNGSWVPPHSGASNTQINVHMSFRGVTELRVRDEWQTMHAGDILCFDDSFLHEVWNKGDEDRWALVVRVMHPAMTHDQDVQGIYTGDELIRLEL